MLENGGQAHPDVAVEETLAGRPRGRVMVQAGALDARAIAFAGSVVDGRDEALARDEVFHGPEDGDGLVVSLASTGPDGRVTLAELRGDAGRTEPRGHGAAASGEEDAGKNRWQMLGGAGVQARGNTVDGPGQRVRRTKRMGENHDRLLDKWRADLPSSCQRGRSLFSPRTCLLSSGSGYPSSLQYSLMHL